MEVGTEGSRFWSRYTVIENHQFSLTTIFFSKESIVKSGRKICMN